MPAAVHARHVLHVLLRYHLAEDVHRRIFASALRPQGWRRRFSVGVDTPQVVLGKQGHRMGTASLSAARCYYQSDLCAEQVQKQHAANWC